MGIVMKCKKTGCEKEKKTVSEDKISE